MKTSIESGLFACCLVGVRVALSLAQAPDTGPGQVGDAFNRPKRNNCELTVSCPGPGGIQHNTDCDSTAAVVSWPPISAIDTCLGPVELADCCTCVHNGVPPSMGGYNCDHLTSSGGNFPQGHYDFTCHRPGAEGSPCGAEVVCTWFVDISNQTTMDVEVQLSPIVFGEEFTRCVCFEIFASCVPEVSEDGFCETITFGGPLFNGHGEASVKIPTGFNWTCITAWDPQHSLKSADFADCSAVSRRYEVVFKGDPSGVGAWLIQGNLNGDAVIDILDFGLFLAQYNNNSSPGPDTTCDVFHTHADFNGDGFVTVADFTFIQRNFLEDDKDSCCPDGGSGGSPQGRTEISAQELHELGLGELIVADLNADQRLNTLDMTLYLEGVRPGASKGAQTSHLRRFRR